MNFWILSTFIFLVISDLGFSQDDGCMSLKEKSAGPIEEVKYVPMNWFETPTIVYRGAGDPGVDHYRILGRNVHMDYVQDYFTKKKNENFGHSQASPNDLKLEILADTVYVKGDVKLRGIYRLRINSRKVIFVKGGRLDLRAPRLSQPFLTLQPGADGDDGKDGIAGPLVRIYSRVLEGYVNIVTNGGDGNKGQDGADGREGPDSLDKRPDKTDWDCQQGEKYGGRCTYRIPGTPGIRGVPGQNGGKAGSSGNGGDAGRQRLYFSKLRGKINLKTCRGRGGQAARNGLGGAGGRGGRGGRGIRCSREEKSCSGGFVWVSCTYWCKEDGRLGEAPRGPGGTKGRDGQAKIAAGADGQLKSSFLQKSSLGEREMNQKYPLPLLKLMTRYAEDLIWANKMQRGKAIFKFLLKLPTYRRDSYELRKVASRRLAFLNKKGYDRFGKNKLFAPLMKWEAFKEEVETLRDHAITYENAYNMIKGTVERQDDVKAVFQALPLAAKTQVVKERERLEEAKRIAISEKGAYVLSIGQLEASMKSTLEEIVAQLPGVYEKAKFNRGDLYVMLQGITGFLSGTTGKDPLATIDTALDVAGHFDTKCSLGTLKSSLKKVKKRLNFGKAYAALKDSTELDFDKMDVGVVPEVMRANLEMNKEGLAADLVCMLDERSLPRNTARLQELIERFFIAGAARIDLIAKVIDLDNDIGGYVFDIANLRETANEIESISNARGPYMVIARRTQQMFLDDLLTSYQQIQMRFAKQLYQLYKGFEFRSLWNVDDKLSKYQRRAVDAAKGTGKLLGAVELTNALKEINQIQNKARKCFTKFRYAVNVAKWSFDNVKNRVMFNELHSSKGMTRFSLKISDSCEQCFNVRLLKMFVELYGDNSQSGSLKYPAKVYLKLRRMSGSYFRDGNGKIKEYRQPLGSWRTFEFNRFSVTNTVKCNQEKKKGNKDSLFCMERGDNRFRPMCCHYLSDSPCDDKLLGAEECQSPFGTYEISIPIDKKYSCKSKSSRITDANCKDFDRSIFTKMKVWIQYLYWTRDYPTGPDDPRCSKFEDPVSGPQEPSISPNITLDYVL